MQLTHAVFAIALAAGTVCALPGALKGAKSKAVPAGEQSIRAPAYTGNAHEADLHANAGLVVPTSREADSNLERQTLKWEDLEGERLASRNIQANAAQADSANSWENNMEFAQTPERVASFSQSEQIRTASQKQQDQKSSMAGANGSFNNQKQVSAASGQQHAIQGQDRMKAERYNQQMDQTEYNGNNNRQQLNIMQKEARSIASQPLSQERVTAQAGSSQAVSEQSLVRQQQAQAQLSQSQQAQAQQALVQEFENQLWQPREETSRIEITSNAAAGSLDSANTRVHLQSRHEQNQSQRLSLENQQRWQQAQQQQQAQQIQQIKQQQQIQAESELMTCLRAALGNLHQETLCLASRYNLAKNTI